MAKILIIDDDEVFCDLLLTAFSTEGHYVDCALTLEAGLKAACGGLMDVVFLDVRLPDGNGLDKLQEIQHTLSAPEVIILTGAGTSDGAELAIKSGAWDYICKPSSVSSMTLALRRALQFREEKLKKRSFSCLKMDGIIGASLPLKACAEIVSEAAICDASVLITGETGTGKELFARAIHENSRRASGNFVVVDCAALTENLTESALFGYEKGAFTGADSRRDGLIIQADGGTLFLDEIGELPWSMQKNFLRVIQERRFRPLGGAKERESDFRLIAATNRNLDMMVEAGQFRKDLLFRIRSITLEAPPLRKHLDDVLDIAQYHTARICSRSGMETKKLSADFREALISYAWPGNVRELVNAVERAVAAASFAPTLFRKHLPSDIRVKLVKNAGGKNMNMPPSADSSAADVFPRLKDLRESTYAQVEKKYLHGLMKYTQGDVEQARNIADLSRTRIYELLRKHQIPV